MRTVLLSLLMAAMALAGEVPVARLADVTFEVPDLDKARQFYNGILGLEEAFSLKDAGGQSTKIYFKVNDDQYVVFAAVAGLAQDFRLRNVTLLSPDLARLRQELSARGLSPGKDETGADGNPHFSMPDPDGSQIQFISYAAGSPQSRHKGKALGSERVSDHLLHAGVASNNETASLAFYSKLGFREFRRGGPAPGDIRWINIMMPGTNGDYMELMVRAADPVANRQHICFEVGDIHRAHEVLLKHGLPSRIKPFLARTHEQTYQWFMNFRDPYGIRVELMGQEAVPSETPAAAPKK